jgi:hypothetical protein
MAQISNGKHIFKQIFTPPFTLGGTPSQVFGVGVNFLEFVYPSNHLKWLKMHFRANIFFTKYYPSGESTPPPGLGGRRQKMLHNMFAQQASHLICLETAVTWHVYINKVCLL